MPIFPYLKQYKDDLASITPAASKYDNHYT